ncbi:SEL1-like repeat protein [Cyclobacterium marinum]|uniref:SEL1-like repeat protein n=1 Tax=Cyclobacterium marinum TaxID=104 RepID=UPI0016596FCC|nr:sel1 repeat family protein [Cyclobacterium marinum]MBI0397972.1 tetratricopeptide repeat protein [Cyclobacterium marinum]
MEEDSRWKIIEQVISELDDPDMLSDVLSRKDSILLGLDKQDPEKRPLFAFFSAVALSEGVSISGWNTNDNLKYHLHRLENKVWSQLDIWKNKNLRTTLGNLIWLAAICEDLTFEDIEKIKNLSPFKRLNDYWEEDSFWEQLESLFKMENSEESKTNFPGLKPDLLAEYYITNHISKTLKNPRLLKSLPILYNAAWNIRPDRVWLMSYLSISNFYNEASSGLNHYLKWVSIAKDLKNEYVGLFFYNLAHLNQRLSRMEEAEKFFLLAIKNNHFGAPNNLGVFYQNLDRLDEAIKYFLIAIENGDEGTLNNLAILYQKMNLKEKAEDLYLKAIEKGCVEPISNLAILYQEMGKLDEAEKYCLLAIKNGIVPAFNNLAIIYQKKDRVKEAENNFLLAIEKGYYYSYRNLAILYQKLDRFKEAEKFYLKAIKVGDLDALNNIGELYLKQGRFYEAEKYFLMAIKNGHLFVFNNLAIVNQNLNRLDKAEKYFLKAIELGLARPLLGLAILYANSGRIKEAEKYFLKAIDKKIEDALFNLALLYDNDDQLQKAEKYYLKSIEKGNIDSLNNLAVIYENNNRLKEAEQFYQKAKKKGFIGAFNNLAVFYWKINKNKDSSWELVNLYIEKNMVKTLKDHVIRLIISAWVQNPFYQQYRSIIFEKVLMEQPNLIRIYILILYHDHSNFLLNAFEERNRVIQSKTIHELEYLVTLYFNKPDDSRLKSIPPKLKNKYDELVTDILGKREFYKKKE